MDGAAAARGQPGPVMSEDHHALDRDLLAAVAQEPLQLVGGLVELFAGRAAPAVGDQPLLDQVPVVVVLVALPAVTVDVHGGVDVLHLDGEQARRAQQQVVDLAAPVAVPAQQRPVSTERVAQLRRDPFLPRDPGLDLLFDAAVTGGRGAGGARRFSAPTAKASRSQVHQRRPHERGPA